MKRTLGGVVLVLLVACSSDRANDLAGPSRPSQERVRATDVARTPGGPSTSAAPAEEGSDGGAVARRVDPREGGLEVGLGEWAVTPEFEPIRPGRVSFLVTNRGTRQHGFEIELDGDNSGPGGGGGLKAESELLDPGQSATVTVDLSPGVYKMECLVDGHDDLGMELLFEVRADAPLKKIVKEPREDGTSSVAIGNFAFEPATLSVPAGTEMTWTNDDPTAHTVTADDRSFDSGILQAGRSFTTTLSQPGTFAYRCQIHPEMQGTVQVTG